MTGGGPDASVERAAFAALAELAGDLEPGITADMIWRAAVGELPAEEIGRLLDRAACSPAVAEAWRLARELQAEAASAPSALELAPAVRSDPHPGPRLRWSRTLLPVGLAAALLVAIGLMPGFQDRAERDPPAFRSAQSAALHSTIGDQVVRSRDELILSWAAATGDGWRYEVLITSAALEELWRKGNLEAPTLSVPSAALQQVPSGARIYWRVAAVNADGRRQSSPTYTVTLR